MPHCASGVLNAEGRQVFTYTKAGGVVCHGRDQPHDPIKMKRTGPTQTGIVKGTTTPMSATPCACPTCGTKSWER